MSLTKRLLRVGSFGPIQALAQDAAVAEPAPVEDPPADGAQDNGDGKAEETPGLKELDKAFDLKISSKSTRDLDKVARLCEQAIEKGLNEAGEEQAKVLAKTAYYEHARDGSHCGGRHLGALLKQWKSIPKWHLPMS